MGQACARCVRAGVVFIVAYGVYKRENITVLCLALGAALWLWIIGRAIQTAIKTAQYAKQDEALEKIVGEAVQTHLSIAEGKQTLVKTSVAESPINWVEFGNWVASQTTQGVKRFAQKLKPRTGPITRELENKLNARDWRQR